MNGQAHQVLIVQGSERRDGDTSAVAEHLARLLEPLGCTAQVLRLVDYTVAPCGACGSCNDRVLPCAVDDDTAAIVERMKAADAIVYGAPVHGFGMAATMQSFVERAGVGYLRFERPLADKVGGAFVVGRRYSHGKVIDQLYSNLLLNRLILVGAGFPPEFHTAGGASPLDDHEAMAALESMAVRMVAMLRSLHRAGGLDSDERLAVNERRATEHHAAERHRRPDHGRPPDHRVSAVGPDNRAPAVGPDDDRRFHPVPTPRGTVRT